MPATKFRILIVDANPAVQDDLRRILTHRPPGHEAEPAGFEIDTVRDAVAAMEMVVRASRAGHPYAIAFVDVRAPLGLESIVQLWKADASLQVVACAAAFDFSWETIAARLGVHGDLLVLRKPFASVEVLQMAHTLAKKWLVAQDAQHQRMAREGPAPAAEGAAEHPSFVETQKLEAVGQLAAGVAHDFNNVLTIIQGHASLQLATGRHDPEMRQVLREIERASERGAALTRQLLAFSQRQVLRPRLLHLNTLLGELNPMLRSLAGERIELRLALADDLPPVWADPVSIEQIIVNLVLNARDAMTEGGGVTIATRTERLGGRAVVQNPEAKPGDYVRLSVIDTGIGMDEATIERIFEPFFTTKPVDKGTGMGLAATHGIARQHGGWIEVASALGEGAAFTVYLPVTQRTADPVEATPPPAAPGTTGVKTILLVEDDDAVRSLVKEMIEYEGYRVIEAANADAALRLWPAHADEISLLLTDMVMPGSANGLKLSRQLLALKPGLRVIYTSGYSTDLFAGDVPLVAGANYLPKPYLSQQLAAILRKAFE